MHWTPSQVPADLRIRRAYLTGEYGSVAYIARLSSGAWHWSVLRYSGAWGIEPTKAMAMEAAERAWERRSEWIKL